MKCERAQEQFSDYFEGALGRSFVVALENHLSECQSCREELQDLKSVWAVLDEAPIVEAPAELRATVWQRIESAEQAKVRRPALAFNWRSLFARPAVGFALAILLLAVLVPVVMPGTRAGLWPWSLLGINRGAEQRISALTATTQMVNGEQVLVIPLKYNAAAAVHVIAQVVNGPATLDAESSSLELGGPVPAELRFHLQPGASGQTLTLEFAWQENGAARTQRLEIKAP